MNFEMPKGFETIITDEEFTLIKRNILAEHKTVVTRISYDIQKVLNSYYVDCIEYGIKNRTEILYAVYANDGTLLMEPQLGEARGVNCPELMIRLFDLEDNEAVIIHNHPNNASFSLQDLFCMCDFSSINFISAIGHDGTVYELCNNGNCPDRKEIIRRHAEISLTLYDEYSKLLKRRIFTGPNEVEQIVRNEVIEQLAYEFGWSYGRCYYYEDPN